MGRLAVVRAFCCVCACVGRLVDLRTPPPRGAYGVWHMAELLAPRTVWRSTETSGHALGLCLLSALSAVLRFGSWRLACAAERRPGTQVEYVAGYAHVEWIAAPGALPFEAPLLPIDGPLRSPALRDLRRCLVRRAPLRFVLYVICPRPPTARSAAVPRLHKSKPIRVRTTASWPCPAYRCLWALGRRGPSAWGHSAEVPPPPSPSARGPQDRPTINVLRAPRPPPPSATCVICGRGVGVCGGAVGYEKCSMPRHWCVPGPRLARDLRVPGGVCGGW